LHYPAYYTLQFVSGTLTITTDGKAPANGNSCNGAYNGTFSGNITVAANQYCVIDSGTVTGNIQSNGGIVVLMNGAKLGGTLQILGTATGPGAGQSHLVCGAAIAGTLQVVSDANSLTVGGANCGTTSIGGSLQMEANTKASALNVTYTTIKGTLQATANAGPILVEYNSIAGDIQITSNTNSVVASYNTVSGSVQIVSNTVSSQVFSNTITSTLQCSGNTAITGGSNKAKVKQGQCASF
jgi:hypothetical protein